MRLIIVLFVLIFLSFFLPRGVSAVSDPLSVANNRFGIHIIDPVDLEDAARLVNSSSGDWGYVTLVITQTQRDSRRWQEVLDKARRLHLIPIIRIASRPLGDIWEKPSLGDIDGWVDFLNSLNWVTQNRYLIIGNEPNHAKEWGGEINPEEYAAYLKEFASKLKSVSGDYFILPAGFDASAANTKETMDEVAFLRRMLIAQPEVFANIDGWSSHSYPNPAFSGPENGFGRGSVRSYEWELGVLKALGIAKNYPVFITETGWAHNGQTDKIGDKLTLAFGNAWNDKRVVAVTPFVLSYTEAPFDTFSWKGPDGAYYDFYSKVQGLAKTKGEPVQEDKAKIIGVFVSPLHLIGSDFSGIIFVKNEGQAIWNKADLVLLMDEAPVAIEPSFEQLEPKSVGLIRFSAFAPQDSGIRHKNLVLSRFEKKISQPAFFQLFTLSPARMKTDSFFDTILRFVSGL
jgi:hypothetical protein